MYVCVYIYYIYALKSRILVAMIHPIVKLNQLYNFAAKFLHSFACWLRKVQWRFMKKLGMLTLTVVQ